MYEALHQKTVYIEIITGEMKFSVWYQHRSRERWEDNMKMDLTEVGHEC
jgi:hypothetical protein